MKNLKKTKRPMAKKKKPRTKPKRVIVWVDGGIADAKMDKGIEWELIDWDNIRAGETWTHEQIDSFAKWGKGLVSPSCIKSLRACAKKKDD